MLTRWLQCSRSPYVATPIDGRRYGSFRPIPAIRPASAFDPLQTFGRWHCSIVRTNGCMARALLMLLAVIGMMLIVPITGASAVCPLQPSMQMMHHDNHPPAPLSKAQCAACLAVLPAPPVPDAQALPPSASFEVQLTSLSGIDPASTRRLRERRSELCVPIKFEMENNMKKHCS